MTFFLKADADEMQPAKQGCGTASQGAESAPPTQAQDWRPAETCPPIAWQVRIPRTYLIYQEVAHAMPGEMYSFCGFRTCQVRGGRGVSAHTGDGASRQRCSPRCVLPDEHRRQAGSAWSAVQPRRASESQKQTLCSYWACIAQAIR